MNGNCLNYHDVIYRLRLWMLYVTLKVSKKDVRDHLTEIPPPFRWVIAACQCCKFDRGRLAVALLIQNFKRFSSPKIAMTQHALSP